MVYYLRALPWALLVALLSRSPSTAAAAIRARRRDDQSLPHAAVSTSSTADAELSHQEEVLRLLQVEEDMSLPPSPPRPPTRPSSPSAPPPSPPTRPSSPSAPRPTRPMSPSAPASPPSPVAAPVVPPPKPVAPTPPGTCVLELNIDCSLDDGAACEDYQPVLEACSGRPSRIGMRYTGGGCDQTNNGQDDAVARCEDFGSGPPTTKGTRSYIVVTDALENGNVLYEDWVEVNDFFNVSYATGSERSQTYINIYSTQDQSQSNLLQFVRFESSCNSPLELGDQFGAVEVTSWTNQDQGDVSAFTGVNIAASIRIQGQEAPGTLTIKSLVIETSFAGTIDLTLLVAGQTIPTGEASVRVPIPTNIDITEPQSYSVKISLSGTSNDGESCSGTLEETYQIQASE